MRIALGVEYDGSDFFGFQLQKNLSTVQSELEKALSKVADEPIQIHCAGRTDTGVHALGQVIHFDTQAERTERTWVLGANTNLPHSITIQWAKKVDEKFHARFSAVKRHYRYVIYNSPIRSSLFRHHALHWRWPLDHQKMQEAAQHLIGEHDFSSFRAADCQSKSVHRYVETLTVKRQNEWITVDIIANAFLHHMVRNIVGTLLEIGAEKKPIEWVCEVLNAKDRTLAGITISPKGLYFMHVSYPEEFALPIEIMGVEKAFAEDAATPLLLLRHPEE